MRFLKRTRVRRPLARGISTDYATAARSARKQRICTECPASAGPGSAVARPLREQLQRIEEPAVGVHLVVEVVAGGASGRADVADDVATLHFRALLDAEIEEVAVAGLEAEPV